MANFVLSLRVIDFAPKFENYFKFKVCFEISFCSKLTALES